MAYLAPSMCTAGLQVEAPQAASWSQAEPQVVQQPLATLSLLLDAAVRRLDWVALYCSMPVLQQHMGRWAGQYMRPRAKVVQAVCQGKYESPVLTRVSLGVRATQEMYLLRLGPRQREFLVHLYFARARLVSAVALHSESVMLALLGQLLAVPLW